MNIEEIQSLNSNIANKKIKMPYPHLKVLDVSDALALIVPSLDKGDLPIICEFEGVTRQIGLVRNSALVINKLNRITRVLYCKDKDVSIDASNMKDLLEVL